MMCLLFTKRIVVFVFQDPTKFGENNYTVKKHYTIYQGNICYLFSTLYKNTRLKMHEMFIEIS